MKFHLRGVILNVRDFSMKVRPIIAQLLYQEQQSLNSEAFAAVVRAREEWVFMRLIDDLAAVKIHSYYRRDPAFEPFFYEIRRAYNEYGMSMEAEFRIALAEAFPTHLIPDPLTVVFKNDSLILQNGQDNTCIIRL